MGLRQGLVYAGLVAAILAIALWRRERADAPEPPPFMPGAAKLPLSPSSPFARARTASMAPGAETAAGTAFSVGENGLWLTARHVIDNCGQVAVVVAEGRGVAARLRASRGDIAVLTTQGGAPALGLAPARGPAGGQLVFLPGFPQGRPGEAAARFLGTQNVRPPRRGHRAQPFLAWAEVGRTSGLKGELAGLSGAPVLDGAGQVVGVTLAWSPRRGRIYSSTPADLRAALAFAGVAPPSAVAGEPLTSDNYGRIADTLRRDLRVARVVCLAG